MSLIFIGAIVIALSLALPTEGEGRTEKKVGGLVIVGPIPIVFGSDKSSALTAAILGVALTALTIALVLLLWWGVHP